MNKFFLVLMVKSRIAVTCLSAHSSVKPCSYVGKNINIYQHLDLKTADNTQSAENRK